MEQKNLPTSPEDLAQIEIMKRSLSIDIYRQCIDENALTRNDSDMPSTSINVNEEKLKIIIGPFVDILIKSQLDSDKSASEFPVPNDFNFELEARNATQTVVSLLHQSGLLNLTMLRETAKYAGPSNTLYDPESVNYLFDGTDMYRKYKESIGASNFNKFAFPYPPLVSERNLHFNITLGGLGLRLLSVEHIKVANEIGIVLSPYEALQLESVRGIGHEYGHALNRSLLQKAVDTFKVSKELGMLRSINLLSWSDEEVSDEHFARGIEDIVTKLYLSRKLKWSDDNISKYFDINTKERYYRTEAAYTFLDYATKKGFTPNEIIALENAIDFTVSRIIKKDVNLWYINNMISYHSKPYSEEQIKVLLSRVKL